LLIKDGHVRLARGPRENGHRPAIDALFRTAARTGGPRVIGVVLSGALDDGTAGLAAIKRCGGIAVAQEPAEALHPGMPASAVRNVAVDYCLPVAEIAPLLLRLSQEPVADAEGRPPVGSDMEQEADMAELDVAAMQNPHRPGTPSAFGCPDCGGVLFELHDGQMVHFRCRVGHAWSPDSLLSEQAHSLEDALWTALRALEENAALSRRLAERSAHRGLERSAAHFHEQADQAAQHALTIRQVLLTYGPLLPPDEKPETGG
jgi:two-component system chemotaxis response regulator CheB